MLNFKHLRQVEETYIEHLKFAIWAGCVLILLGVVSVVHGIFPFFLSRVPDKIFRYFLLESEERISRVNKILKNKNLE